MSQQPDLNTLKARFRGYFPVVVDVETAGFNAKTDALLEMCAITLRMDDEAGYIRIKKFIFMLPRLKAPTLKKPLSNLLVCETHSVHFAGLWTKVKH